MDTFNTVSWVIVAVGSVVVLIVNRMQRRWAETTQKELQKEIESLKTKLNLKENANTLLFKELSGIKANDISTVNNEARAEFYLIYLAMCERERGLFLLLQNHFPNELEIGQIESRSLITVASVILLRQKQELDGRKERV